MKSPDPALPFKVDFSRMREIAETPAELREFLELYLSETAAQLGKVEPAIAQRKLPDVARLAHTMAGASATCGIETMVPLLKQLEECGRNGDFEGCDVLRRQLAEEFNRVKIFLNQHIQSL